MKQQLDNVAAKEIPVLGIVIITGTKRMLRLEELSLDFHLNLIYSNFRHGLHFRKARSSKERKRKAI